MYVSQKEIKAFVKLAQANEFSTGLYNVIRKITHGLGGTEDDAHTACLVLLKNINRINLDLNVFAFLTQMVKQEIWTRQRNERSEMRKYKNYYKDSKLYH